MNGHADFLTPEELGDRLGVDGADFARLLRERLRREVSANPNEGMAVQKERAVRAAFFALRRGFRR